MAVAVTGGQDVSDDEQALVQTVTKAVEAAERQLHSKCAKRWDHFWALWRSYHDLKGELRTKTDRRDRDQGLREAAHEWGSTLFIPYVFATIETTLPRLVAHRPRMLVLPRNPQSENNAPNMRFLIDVQQERTQYELKLQSTGKVGLITGLGVQKTHWLRKTATRRVLGKASGLNRALRGVQWVERNVTEVLVDDPEATNVLPWDFFWAPLATGMDDCSWATHRLWLDTRQCWERIQSGQWGLAADLELADLEGSGSQQRYQTATAQRQKIDGIGYSGDPAGIHEVLEFHNREHVITVLDRKWVVAMGLNPLPYAELPFQVYRPTEIPGQLYGSGEAEAIEDLQIEMNTLRTQRRDAATLSIARGYFYQDGVLEPNDFKIFPGALIPVDSAVDPKDVLHPIEIREPPNSGYNEEDRLRADIERVSGMLDVIGGGSDGTSTSSTATGAQLVFQGANARIGLKSRRLELEIVKRQARHFGLLNQRRIQQKDIPIPYVPKPGEAERRFAWIQLTPIELAGEFAYETEGGSMAPENIPQQRNDAMLLANLILGQPEVDRRKVLLEILTLAGLKRPETYLAPDQTVPPATLDLMMQALVEHFGFDPELARNFIGQALSRAREMEAANEQQGPIELPPPDEQVAEGQGEVQGGPQRPLARQP